MVFVDNRRKFTRRRQLNVRCLRRCQQSRHEHAATHKAAIRHVLIAGTVIGGKVVRTAGRADDIAEGVELSRAGTCADGHRTKQRLNNEQIGCAQRNP